MRVDFYLIEDLDERALLKLACRLTEKAFSQDHKVCIAVSSSGEAEKLDKLLWTFRDGSFIPHEIASGTAEPQERVVITAHTPPAAIGDVLINLCPQVPGEFTRFQRVIEPLDGDPARRKQGRERFKYYRQHGITPQSHQLAPDHDV